MRTVLAAVSMLAALAPAALADEPLKFPTIWSQVVRGLPDDFEPQGETPAGPTSGEQSFRKSAPGKSGRVVQSTINLVLETWPLPSEPQLAAERKRATDAGLEILEMGNFATLQCPSPPRPRNDAGSIMRRPPPAFHGEMAVFVIQGNWRFKVTLDASTSHYSYDEAKALVLETAQALRVRLGMATEGEPPVTPQRDLQHATRLVLGPDEKVDPALDDPDAWQAWIEAEFEKRRGKNDPAFPADYRRVARTFRDVGASMKLPDERRMNWPALLVQSIHETGFYRFGRRADASNFNVAGVGITESEGTTTRQNFGDLETGVKAFFQHMSVYATGQKVKDPVAERTKLSQGTVAERVSKFIEKFPNRGPIALRDLGTQFAGDAQTARKWSGLDPNKVTDDAAHIARVKKLVKAQFETYGGGTLGYSGDPLYCGKVMAMWLRATAEVRQLAAARKANKAAGGTTDKP